VKRLKEQIKDLYGEFSLSAKQMQALEELEGQREGHRAPEASQYSSKWASGRRRIAAALGAFVLTAVLLFFFYPLNSINKTEEFAREIAYHYNKQMSLELESNSFDEIKSFFHKLDFSLIKSAKLPEQDWELLGGRYCTVKGVLGAQLRVQRRPDGKIYTFYQALFPDELGDISDTYATYQEGVKVELWKERGLLLALTGDD